MPTSLRWTSADLESLPDDGKRYEIVDGELHLSKQPHWYHQVTCFNISFQLQLWNQQTGRGQVNFAPGIIFAEDDDKAKLKLYSQRGVGEYWIVGWRARQVEVYRREQAQLRLVATLFNPDTLNSPLLPRCSSES
ncbi:MAG TPA: Uma2 family endonuclease [Blastocatellia bacterium]|jgi:Uma2 family endonuclease